MNAQQRAVVAAAKKDGLSPMEIAAELMNHDITEVVLGLMRKREVAFNKLSEKDQDAVIAEIGFELKKITATAARVINGQGVECVQAKMKSLKIDGKLTATMVIEGDEPNRHVLTDKTHDKSDILIVLYPNNYSEGMSAHQGERDQKPLDLDGCEQGGGSQESTTKKTRGSIKKAGDVAKTIEIPPKLLEDARAFVVGQQNATYAGLQNKLSIGLQKAERILELLAEEGHVKFVGDSKDGQYELVRQAASPAEEPNESGLAPEKSTDSEPGDTEPNPVTELTDDLYDQMAAKVREKGSTSAGALSVAFDVPFEIAEQAFDRMELEGVIDAEGNLSPDETFPVMD